MPDIHAFMSPDVVEADQPFGSVFVAQTIRMSPEEPSSSTVSATDCELVILNDEFMDIRQ